MKLFLLSARLFSHLTVFPIDYTIPDRCVYHGVSCGAEMRLPGRAWLQFALEDTGKSTLIRQTAIFDPIGVAGLMY